MARAMSLRPMGILEIVDQSFRLYRSNFLVFFGIAAVVYVPVVVLQSIRELEVLGWIIFAPLYGLAGAALTRAVSDRYLGEPMGIGRAYAYVARRLAPFALTILAAYLFVLSGVLLLVVGAFVFAIWISFVPQVFVIEDKRYMEAVWRSRFLVGQGVWGELIVLNLIVGVFGSVIGGAIGWAAQTAGIPQAAPVAWGLILGSIQALVLPIGQAATVLLYYDSRIRKEGFDLMMLAREMGMAPPQAAAGAPGPGPSEGV